MPRKNESKPAKRAKLSGIARFFTEPRQEEQTSISATHISSDTSNNLPCTSSTPIVNQLQSNTTCVNNPSTSLAESVELDREESQGLACASISSPSQHNEKQPSATFSETPVFSDFLAANGYSCEPVSSSNAITAKSNNLISLDKPNHPNISVIPAQKLSKRTLLTIFNQSGMKITNRYTWPDISDMR